MTPDAARCPAMPGYASGPGLLAPLIAARPQWAAVSPAAQALGLRRHELLHAGPPFRDARRPPPVLMSSIVMTCLHEGWAGSEAEAERLVHDGALQLSPAQDRFCVTPLAAVVSPATPLLVVRNAAEGTFSAHSLYAPLATVGGPDTRMGARDAGLLSRLSHRDEVLVPFLQARLESLGAVELLPLMSAGLAAGDDLHSRTTAANEALVQLLRSASSEATPELDGIAANPLFFLTLWMAACALMLRAAEGAGLPSLVTRAGGNGEAFAIALAGRPARWIICDAAGLDGPRLPGKPAGAAVAGAIGDSAVIDLLGLGGQRLQHAPEPLSVFRPYLPEGIERQAQSLLVVPHPGLAGGWPVGLDAARVAATRQAPLVVLAMLADDGVGGMLGRGVYRPPVSLFEDALRVPD